MAHGRINPAREGFVSTGGVSPELSSESRVSNERYSIMVPQTIDLQASSSQTAAGEKARKSATVVAACILRPGGREVLLSMRDAPGVPGLDGKWELPGGKIEFGESPE